MSELTFKSIEWNDDLVGFCVELSNGKYVQIQFDRETNRLHADYNRFTAVIDKENDYELNLTDEEEDSVISLIRANQEIKEKELELDEAYAQ
jgi:hypothetical protein